MPVILSPAGIPDGANYYLHCSDVFDISPWREGALAVLMQNYINSIVENSSCLGSSANLAECIESAAGAGACVVSHHPDAINFAWDSSVIYFIPLPIGNFSSYFNYGQFTQILNDSGKCAFIDKRERFKMLINLKVIKKTAEGFSFDRTEVYPCFAKDLAARKSGEISDISGALSDQNSRDAFFRAIYGTPFMSFDYFVTNMFVKTQYFDYLRFDDEEAVVINCGVDSGWEIPFFEALSRKRAILHNIDPVGDEKLSVYARQFVEPARDRMIFHKTGVWNCKTRLAFNSNNTVSEGDGGLSEGSTWVDVISIDEFCREQGLSRVDIIKMDLEGAEPKAIEGMKETVERFRPQLAISAYHKLEHYIDIPMSFIKGLSGYNFYMDTYNYDLGETIFYAIPWEKDRKNRRVLVFR